ncbi:hypothetical protein TNCV_1634681 [Trichonephila clavipes]|nr:hypothetical protein TNCV_1634681 [Trichonephila clavipes]
MSNYRSLRGEPSALMSVGASGSERCDLRRLRLRTTRQTSSREDHHMRKNALARSQLLHRLPSRAFEIRGTPLLVLPLTPTHPDASIGEGAALEESGLQRNEPGHLLATNSDSVSAVMTIVFECGTP